MTKTRVASLLAFSMLLVVLLSSCSGYSKLLKSGSSEQKYEKAKELMEAKKYQKALELFKDVEAIYARTERADSVKFYIGMCNYRLGDFMTSSQNFDDFRRTYGRSPFLEQAEYYFAKGFCYMSPGSQNDQTNTNVAIQALTEYLEHYPKSHKREELIEELLKMRQKLYDKAYLNAKLYYDIGYYNSAVTSLHNAILKYPDSNHKEELSYLIVCAHYQYARNSVAAVQRQRYLDMQNAYYTFIDAFPESTYRAEVDRMQKEAVDYLAKFDGDKSTSEVVKEESNNDKPLKAVKAEKLKKAKKSESQPEPKVKKSKKSNNSNTENGTEEE